MYKDSISYEEIRAYWNENRWDVYARITLWKVSRVPLCLQAWNEHDEQQTTGK